MGVGTEVGVARLKNGREGASRRFGIEEIVCTEDEGREEEREKVKASLYGRGAGGSHEGLVKHLRSGGSLFLKMRVSYSARY